jgi:hypothetical protein
MSDDTGGKYVCAGGFVISGMIAGSWYGGVVGGAVGGAPAIPGAVLGAAGGALWAALICTRPAIKRFFQIPLDKLKNDFDEAMDVGSLRSELQTFIQDSAPDLASRPDAVVAFMLEYFYRNRREVFALANNRASVVPILSAKAKQGIDILRTARPLV